MPRGVGPPPLVIERIAFGDRDALKAVADELSNLTGQPVSHYLLLLQEFADAVREVASERLFLAFEDAHPLWSQFNREERQAIVRALFDLGFRYDAEEGWYGGRAPGTATWPWHSRTPATTRAPSGGSRRPRSCAPCRRAWWCRRWSAWRPWPRT